MKPLSTAQLLQAIRDHERQCQGRCAACQARQARQLNEIARQHQAEEDARQLLAEQQKERS